MKTKRILCALLAVSLLFTLAGCGVFEESREKEVRRYLEGKYDGEIAVEFEKASDWREKAELYQAVLKESGEEFYVVSYIFRQGFPAGVFPILASLLYGKELVIYDNSDLYRIRPYLKENFEKVGVPYSDFQEHFDGHETDYSLRIEAGKADMKEYCKKISLFLYGMKEDLKIDRYYDSSIELKIYPDDEVLENSYGIIGLTIALTTDLESLTEENKETWVQNRLIDKLNECAQKCPGTDSAAYIAQWLAILENK